jgi:branched-chain amino acid transport system substrate-binding protein
MTGKQLNNTIEKEEKMKKRTGVRICSVLMMMVGCLLFSFGTSATSSYAVDTVNVAFVLGLTGPTSTYGVPMRDAMNWALGEINKDGGFKVDGKTYKLNVTYYDDASKPEVEAPGLLKKALYSDKVPILFIGGSTLARMAIPFMQQGKTPTVVILASILDLTEKSQYIFRIRPDAAQVSPPLAIYFKELGYRRYACVGADNDFSRDCIGIWKTVAQKAGGQILAEEYFTPGKVQDFYPILSKIKSLNPDAVFVGGYTQEAALVYKQAHEVGLKMPLGGYNGMTPEQAKDLIGVKYNEVLNNVLDARGIDPSSHPDKRVRDWSKQFKEKFGYTPADLTMWAWDAPFLAIEAFQKAHSVTDRDKIREALVSLDMSSVKKCLTPYVGGDGNKLFDGRQAFSTTVVLGWGKDDWVPKKYYATIKGVTNEIKY